MHNRDRFPVPRSAASALWVLGLGRCIDLDAFAQQRASYKKPKTLSMDLIGPIRISEL